MKQLAGKVFTCELKQRQKKATVYFKGAAVNESPQSMW
jgi:hypothetical protein